MQVILSLIVALAAALLAPKFLAPYLPASLQPTPPAPVVAEPEVKETAFQRVMRTGVIKCGYYLQSPFLVKNPKTGGLGGVSYEVVKGIAGVLGLKVEWTAEVQPNDVEVALNANQFDLLCVTSSLGKVTQALTHTKPVYYSMVWAVARADDNRFDSDIGKINDASITIAEQEGDTLLSFDKNALGGLKSKIHSLPQSSKPTAQFDAVVAKQADVTFVETIDALEYASNKPRKIKFVPDVPPMGVLGEFYAMKAGENELKNALDEAIDKLNNAEEISRVLVIHNMIADAFLKPLGLKEAGAKDVPSLLPAKISYDATWLKKEATGSSKQPTAEELKALGDAPAAEPVTESAPEPVTAPKPDDAALEKPAEVDTEKATDAEAPAVKAEDGAAKTETSDDDKAVDEAATPKADTETKTEEKAEAPKAEPKKAVAKPVAPPAPTLGDVKDALEEARKAAAAKAAEAGNLPPGVTAPQPLTGSDAARGVISPSLPESTITPTSIQ